MHNFCTYFDASYLDRGVSVWRSLRAHCHNAQLYVCCLDQKTFNVLRELAFPGLHLIELAEIETAYPSLLKAKETRSKLEYYFTITASLVRFTLEERNAEEVTYIDSDLLFFSSPEPLFEEMDRSDASVAIIAHRFTSDLAHLTTYGIYNVGWVSFKKSADGLACLYDWQQKCIDWCFDRVEGERFADQKYLDAWPGKFPGVKVLKHPGANVALWNLVPGSITKKEGRLEINEQPLIFYHFHGLSQITGRLFFTSSAMYSVRLDRLVLREIYGRYILILRAIQRELRSVEVRPLLRYKHSAADVDAAKKDPGDSRFLLAVLSFTFRPPRAYWRWTERGRQS